MKSVVVFVLAAIASGSPTPVAMTTAPAPFYGLVGTAAAQTPNSAPVIGVSTELVVYDADRIAAAISAAVTDVATPLSARNLGLGVGVGLDLCIVILGIQIPPGCEKTSSTGHHTTTTTVKPVTTAAATCKTKTTAVLTTTAPATTPTSVYVSVPSTCTPTGWVNTNSYTSIAACPTAVEVGTYCGFINPDDPCAPQLSGSAPKPSADSASAFLANKAYTSLATQAATPSGYVSSFTNLNGAVQGNTYLGYETLSSYDTKTCAAYCDATELCTGFNIYIERDPSFNPEGCSCTDPPANYNYKCSIFAGGVYSSAATNVGQQQDDFEVVIAASNGYVKSNTTTAGEVCLPSGCSKPHTCWGKAHSHAETSLKEAFFPGAFNIDLCIELAVVQTQINVAASVNSKAAFLNAALIERDGEGWGTWCGVFTEPYTSDDCNWSPGPSGGHSWGCQDSWGIEIDVDVFLGLQL